ncbi:MAG TPA: hypothetical protein VKV40_18245 [Ktedonobacteraceae bacterium]|nr:hypothetical protein [Ktedonobacteraceae bacterium]
MLPQCITVAATTSTLADEREPFMRGNSTPLAYNTYATISMFAVEAQSALISSSPDSSEEELYASFEQAISDRVTAINSKLQRITPSCGSALVPDSPCPTPVRAGRKMARNPLQFLGDWQRLVRLGCLALMFLLIGFDLMGLLVMYLR